ncbi:MAG TPA: hypothetical protein PLF21_05420 [Exilispira sp.]|nr:hypothetical protein [Exilispira sp.]
MLIRDWGMAMHQFSIFYGEQVSLLTSSLRELPFTQSLGWLLKIILISFH